MRTRHKKLSDYGIPESEVNGLYDLCRNLDDCERELLHVAAVDSCPVGIVSYVEQSLIDGVSYDAMSKSQWVPIGRDDFYGYRRKTLAAFYWARKGMKTNETEC